MNKNNPHLTVGIIYYVGLPGRFAISRREARLAPAKLPFRELPIRKGYLRLPSDPIPFQFPALMNKNNPHLTVGIIYYVGLPGIEPGSYPPQGYILPLYYSP